MNRHFAIEELDPVRSAIRKVSDRLKEVPHPDGPPKIYCSVAFAADLIFEWEKFVQGKVCAHGLDTLFILPGSALAFVITVVPMHMSECDERWFIIRP